MATRKAEATGVVCQDVGNVHFHAPITVTAGNPGYETAETEIPTSTVFNPRTGIRVIWRPLLAVFFEKKFRKFINGGSWRKTDVKITEDYKREDLEEPEFHVYPQMRKGIRFYKGEYAKEEGFSIASLSNSGELITHLDLVKEIAEGESRFIAVVGQAGSGKTTIMKRIAQMIMVANRLTEGRQTESSVLARRFKLVYYANIKDLPTSTMSVPELLFGEFRDLNANSLSFGYDWILHNETQVIFFLDGLDQAPWDLVPHTNMGLWDVMSTETIVSNLILGNILNRVKVVISSREHKIATLPEELRPHFIVSLAGLGSDDIQKLFIAVMGDGGKNEWDEMCKTSPVLVRLSSIPLFLIFNAIVRKYCQVYKINPPDSMTGIMCHLLDIIPKSNHTLIAESILKVMQKLRPMAYQGMKEKRVTFTQEDLQRHGLQMKEVQDLIIKVPDSNMLAQRIFEADCKIFFAHQAIQEFLAAEHCMLMAISEFKEFLDEFCHEDHWLVVRKFLCGILINAQLRKGMKAKISNESGIDEKRVLLKKSLDQRLQEATDQLQFLEILGSLYEANDPELIESHVTKISFDGILLTPDAMHTISSIMRRCDYLSVFLLKNCDINEKLINILETNTRNCKLQIEVMAFDRIAEQTTQIFIAIAKLATRFQVKEVQMKPWSVLQLGEDELLELGECTVYGKAEILNIGTVTKEARIFITIAKFATNCQAVELQMEPWLSLQLGRDQIIELSTCTICGKVQILDLQVIEGSTFSLFLAIARVATRCEAKEVRMKPWAVLQLGEDELKELSKWRVCGKVEVFDLGEIGQQVFRFFITIASVAARCRAKEIRMKPWPALKLCKDELWELNRWTICGKVEILDLGETGEHTFVLFLTIARVATSCQAKEVWMKSWPVLKLSEDEILALSKWTVCGKVEILDLGETREESFSLLITIASVTTRCQAKEVWMKPWPVLKLSEDEILELSKSTVCGKFKKLNLSANSSLKPEGCKAVGCVVRQCGVEDLNIEKCGLTAEHIAAIQDGIGNGNFKKFNLSANSSLKPEGCKAVGCVVRQCGVEDLIIEKCGLTAEHIAAIQDGIGNGNFKKFGVSRNESLEAEGCKAVGGVVRQCGIEDLAMRLCALTAEHITTFQKGIGDGKMRKKEF